MRWRTCGRRESSKGVIDANPAALKPEMHRRTTLIATVTLQNLVSSCQPTRLPAPAWHAVTRRHALIRHRM